MLFDRLKIPDPLLEASENGRLVVFAGAGISKAPPSSLPGFEELIDWLEKKSGIPREARRFDTYLGILHDRKCDVHRWCLERLTEKPSLPNAYHELLIGLFPDPRKLRIVTTNFDEHFGTQLESLKLVPQPRRYCAPALPLGREFTGLVHLHGAMAEPDPRIIVLTDRDLGMAYLSDGWARTFVQELFQTFVVLFVGYKHGDPPVEYLARGMSGRSQMGRYALTIEEDAPIWAKYDVNAVPYQPEAPPNRHAALERGLREWVSFLQSQPLDIEDRVRALVTSEMVPDPIETEFLKRCMQRVDWTQYFVRHASGPRWVRWLAGQELLQACFDLRDSTLEKLDGMLPEARERWKSTAMVARWLGQQFVQDAKGELLSHALACGQPGNILWQSLGSNLLHEKVDFSEIGTRRWLLLLIESARMWRRRSLEPLPWILRKLEWPQDQGMILTLFRLLLQPRFHLEREFEFDPSSPGGSVEVIGFDVEIPTDAYELQEAWRKFFLQDSTAALQHMLPILEDTVSAIYHGLRGSGMARSGSDKLTIIRDHLLGRNYPHVPDGLDLVVNWIAELVREHANSPTLGVETAERWLRSGVPILYRCAFFLLGESTRITGQQVVELLALGPWFYTEVANARTELYATLAAAYPRLDAPQKERLWRLIEVGPPASWAAEDANRDEAAAYERDRLVAWLAEEFPQDELARDAVARLRGRSPNFVLSTGGNADHEMGISTRDMSPVRVQRRNCWLRQLLRMSRFSRLTKAVNGPPTTALICCAQSGMQLPRILCGASNCSKRWTKQRTRVWT